MPLRILATSAVTCLVLAAPAGAAWNPDPVTGGNRVSGDPAYFDHLMHAAPDGAGGAFVLTRSEGPGGMHLNVQHVDAQGTGQWGPDGVDVSLNGHVITLPARVVPDGSGGAYVLWMDQRTGDSRIYTQRLAASGVPYYAAGGVDFAYGAAPHLYLADAIPDGAGSVLVSANQDDGIFAPVRFVFALHPPSGGYAWNAVLLSAAWGTLYPGMLCSDGAGGAIVTYLDSGGDIRMQRVLANGTLAWAFPGVTVHTSAASISLVRLVCDDQGGAIVGFLDVTSDPNGDVIAVRVNSAGTPQWTVGAGDPPVFIFDVSMTSDGQHGAIFSWTDHSSGNGNISASRVSGGGERRWGPNGVAVHVPDDAHQGPHDLIADGLGGAIVLFQHGPFEYYWHVSAQRLSPSGGRQWGDAGIEVCSADYGQVNPLAVADGQGGAIGVWEDYRPPGYITDVYAQRIDRFGVLGDPAPAITHVGDVLADQGGRVALEWSASYMDRLDAPSVTQYSVWRRVPSALAQAALARGASLDAPLDAKAPAAGRYVSRIFGAQTTYWEFVEAMPAALLPGYSYVCATTTDSLPGSNPLTSFMVASEQGTRRWFSAPDSGYSVDNLPPAAPAPFTGAYASGAAHLHWLPNAELDLGGYRIYRGSSAGFPTDPAHFVADVPDTGYADVASAGFWYKLTAVDVHGNESPAATLSPHQTLDAPGAPAAASWFAAPHPNPSREGSTLRFGIAGRGRVTLVLHDVGGRVLRTLADAVFEAGEHALRWDGRDDGGRRAAPGLYFARLIGPGVAETRRIAVVE